MERAHDDADPRPDRRLYDMTPRFAANDVRNCGAVHAVIPSEFRKHPAPICVARSNIAHVVASQLRNRHALATHKSLRPYARAVASARRLSPLLVTVAHVVKRRAKEQVIWTNTCFHIAMMTDEQSVRDWPVVQFIRVAMRNSILVVCPKASVPAFELRPAPQPAGIRLLHPGPESFYRIGCILAGHLLSFQVGAMPPAAATARWPLCTPIIADCRLGGD